LPDSTLFGTVPRQYSVQYCGNEPPGSEAGDVDEEEGRLDAVGREARAGAESVPSVADLHAWAGLTRYSSHIVEP
jgi:hypothetical protein